MLYKRNSAAILAVGWFDRRSPSSYILTEDRRKRKKGKVDDGGAIVCNSRRDNDTASCSSVSRVFRPCAARITNAPTAPCCSIAFDLRYDRAAENRGPPAREPARFMRLISSLLMITRSIAIARTVVRYTRAARRFPDTRS